MMIRWYSMIAFHDKALQTYELETYNLEKNYKDVYKKYIFN